MRILIVDAKTTPSGVGIVQEGTLLIPYAECCGGGMSRRKDYDISSVISCECGKTAVPPNSMKITLELKTVTPGVYSKYVANFTGYLEEDISVDVVY